MSSGFGPGSSSFETTTPTQPWVWVFVPVGIVIVIGAAAVFLHSQRKARLPQEPPMLPTSNAYTLHAQRGRSRAFHERDLPSVLPGRLSRWHAGTMPRSEEGLNELGEAPPPYEKRFAPPPLPTSPSPEPGAGAPGPAPESSTHSPAGSLRGGVEMHALATTGTATTTSRSSAQGMRAGASRNALSPFSTPGAPSTAASSMPSLALVHTGPGTGGPPLANERPGSSTAEGRGEGSGVTAPVPAVLAWSSSTR